MLGAAPFGDAGLPSSADPKAHRAFSLGITRPIYLNGTRPRWDGSLRMSLRYVVQALLTKEPNSGYGIGRLLRGRLSHLWGAAAALQQIYAELSRLEAQGMVQAEPIAIRNRPAKKIYTLTSAGSTALDRWLAQPPAPGSRKDDLLVKLYCLERLPNHVITRHLEERQSECESLAWGLRGQIMHARRTNPSELGYLLTLEAALSDAESQASWCVRTMAYLREGHIIASGLRGPSQSTRDQAAA